jgi:hypothetical protein
MAITTRAANSHELPRNLGQVPIYYNALNTGRSDADKNVFWSHYSDVEKTPQFILVTALAIPHLNIAHQKLIKQHIKRRSSKNTSKHYQHRCV